MMTLDNTLDTWEERDAREMDRADDAVQALRDREIVEYFEYLRDRAAIQARLGGAA